MRCFEFCRAKKWPQLHAVFCALVLCVVLSPSLGQSAADAPAVVTLYTAFLDPLPQLPQHGFSVKLFKLRTMHALVAKAKALQSSSLRVLHVEVPGHDELATR